MLASRERCKKEIILVCNDFTEEKFPGCRLINMCLSDYQKTLMCNTGVGKAKGEIVALMDSDRVMPAGYFSSIAESLRPKEFVTCEKLLKLTRSHTDEEIEKGEIEFEEDFRSKGWEIWRKNLFSGNTVFHKEDYLLSGGQDESFSGYGFADNDMTRNVMTKGFSVRWTKEEELHLFHPAEIMESGRIVDQERYLKKSKTNLCRFLKKWGDKEEYARNCGCMI